MVNVIPERNLLVLNFAYHLPKPLAERFPHDRVVPKISSCWVNTTSRRGIKQLGISFGAIFLLFSHKIAGNHTQVAGEIPGPRLLMTTLHENGKDSLRPRDPKHIGRAL